MQNFIRSFTVITLLTATIPSLKAQSKIDIVWNDINRAIGTSYLKPNLEVMSGKPNGPAFFRNGIVYYDSIFINHLIENHDSEFVELSIAYLLSHELGHFNLRHTDTHLKSMAYAKTNSKSVVISGQSRKEDLLFKESEADLYGGLYSAQAGYYALDAAEDFLIEVYDYYQLPKELPGYPSLYDRIKMSENLKPVVWNINESYQIAVALAYLGEHKASQNILKSIIRETDFKTTEILHMLSYSIFLSTVAEVDDYIISNWQWPVKISFEAYKTGRDRSAQTELLMDRIEESLLIELDALRMEDNTESNLRSSLELIKAFLSDEMKNFQSDRLKDDSLLAMYWHLKGKKKRAIKLLRSSKSNSHNYTLVSGNLLPTNKESIRQSLPAELLFELRFANSKNILINGKRIAKKRSYENFAIYEMKKPNGVKLTLIKEVSDQALPHSNEKAIIIANNSVLFNLKHETIKYFLE